MKLSLASTVISVATVLFPVVNADNTPNLCTADITDLVKIKPSDASGLVPPNITVGGFEYNGDAEHFVIGSASSEHNNRVLVYLPGTTDRPELSSCLLKSVADSPEAEVTPNVKCCEATLHIMRQPLWLEDPCWRQFFLDI